MLNEYATLLRESVTDPRAAARRLFAMQIDRQSLWLILGVLACLSVTMIFATVAINPPDEGEISPFALFRPIPLAVVLLATWSIMAGCTYFIGKGFGGVGNFDNSLKSVIWIEIVQTTYLAIQIVLLFVSPLLGLFVSLAAVFLIIRCYVMLVTELHGFASPPLVFAGILVSSFAVLFVVSILFGIFATILGIEVQNV